MGDFYVAHVREQGQNMILVFVDSSFGRKSNAEQNRIKQALQQCAAAAGLAGTVVPVWDSGFGRWQSFPPPQWQGFFRSLDIATVAMSVNTKLTCR